MKKRKSYRNGKDPRKSVKPAQSGICSDCQYKIYEAVVDKVKVKEKDVFNKPNPKKTPPSSVKSQRPNQNQKSRNQKK